MPTPCPSPLLFRHRETGEYRLAPCRRWGCPSCRHLLAAHWRAALNWVTQAGHPPQFLITLTLRETMPLWGQALKAAAVALARFLTRALSSETMSASQSANTQSN